MEEKKLNPENKTNNPLNQKEKLTYSQLNDVCNQLYQQNQKLVMQLRQMDMSNTFKRLDYLFEVVKASNVFKDAEFINNCVAEIKEALYPQKVGSSEEPAQSNSSE